MRFARFIKRKTKIVSFKDLLNRVRACNGKVQASFVSKMLHTLNDKEPIYDSAVRTFLEIKDPYRKNIEERQEAVARVYDQIRSFYSNKEEHEKLKAFMLEAFEEKTSDVENDSYVKKLDFVMWALGKQKVRISELELCK